MAYYILEETMRSCTADELHSQTGRQYVAVLTTSGWQRERDCFDMGIEWEPDAGDIHNTKDKI